MKMTGFDGSSIVTDLKYHLEKKLVRKLDLMIERCTNKRNRKDAVLTIEGDEGEGKTNSSVACGYYVKFKTKRDLHMFFRLEPLIEFAKKTENKIIIWDEPALDFLSSDWWKESNKDLIRLLMTCRKKRHFILLNFVKFYKFCEYIVVDRGLGLIHMYSRKGKYSGRFVYIKKKNLERLYNSYRRGHVRDYYNCKSFGGSFPVVEKHMGKMGIIINGHKISSLEEYEELKDQAIESISGKKKNVHLENLNKLKSAVGKLQFPIMTQKEFADKLGIASKTMYNWKQMDTEGMLEDEKSATSE